MLALRMASLVAMIVSWSVVGVEPKAMWKVLMQPCSEVHVNIMAIQLCLRCIVLSLKFNAILQCISSVSSMKASSHFEIVHYESKLCTIKKLCSRPQ